MAINAILLLLAGASLSAGAIAHNAPLMIVGIVLIGISYGGAPSLTSSVTHSCFGAKNLPANFSVANFTSFKRT